MNKKSLILSLLFLTPVLFSCSANNETEISEGKYAGQTLTIYNCQDYISNGEDDTVDLIAQFEEETGCKVNYYTYDTNETMYNQFKLQKEGTYDLICTSDYMIQKMIKEELVTPLDDIEEYIPNYYEYCSPMLRDKLSQMETTYQGNTVNLDQFTVGYMWGTLGIVYDPEYVDEEDVKSWDVFWNEKYKDLISIKNSMRDTFVVGLMHSYSKTAEFQEIMNDYLSDPNDENCQRYNDLIQNIFDFKFDGSEESNQENLQKIELVKNELIECKKNIFGLEVDSGKNDIITGKIKMNLAWSGDAVYSIDTALEEVGKSLKYSVPEDGANVWYDGWTLPVGANKELAYEFLNFLSDPVNAAENVNYIGYTSFIAGQELFDLASSWYGIADYNEDSYYEIGDQVLIDQELYICNEDTESSLKDKLECFEKCIYDEDETYYSDDLICDNGIIYGCIYEDEDGICGASLDDENVFVKIEPYDLSYFFGDKVDNAYIYPYPSCANTLETQYPSKEIVARCGVMNDFGTYNDNVIIMWGQVKAYTDMTPVYIFLIAVVVLLIITLTYFIIKKRLSAHYKRTLKK